MASDRERELESELIQANALLEWVGRALCGEQVSDFAESFPIVRMAIDVKERARYEARLELELKARQG